MGIETELLEVVEVVALTPVEKEVLKPMAVEVT